MQTWLVVGQSWLTCEKEKSQCLPQPWLYETADTVGETTHWKISGTIKNISLFKNKVISCTHCNGYFYCVSNNSSVVERCTCRLVLCNCKQSPSRTKQVLLSSLICYTVACSGVCVHIANWMLRLLLWLRILLHWPWYISEYDIVLSMHWQNHHRNLCYKSVWIVND